MLSDCIEWVGSKTNQGYGVIRLPWAGLHKLAHRVAYENHHKVILTRDQHVLHSCDNPACINVNHLRIGDQRQNNKDRDLRGRQARGTRNGRAVISEEHARHILESSDSAAKLSKLYGVNKKQINRIRRGERWAHLTLSPEAESIRKARSKQPAPSAKLNEHSVRAIRASNRSHRELAEIYGVSATTIARVRSGRDWSHVK